MTASARKFVMLGVTVAMLAAAGSAPASAPFLQVNGAGYTSKAGHVVINARTTGPLGELTAPATGFVKIAGSIYGDLTGSVACVGTLGSGPSAAVSGTLNR